MSHDKVHDHYIVERVGVAVDREGTVMLQLFSEDQPRGKRVFLSASAASVLLWKLVAAGIRHAWVAYKVEAKHAKEDTDRE